MLRKCPNKIVDTFIFFIKPLVFEKGASSGECSVSFYKNLPTSFSELGIQDYSFVPRQVGDRYVMNGVLSEIYGHYWVVFHCKTTGDDDEHNYYKFYFT